MLLNDSEKTAEHVGELRMKNEERKITVNGLTKTKKNKNYKEKHDGFSGF